ncbi:MAG: hypothetical protein K8F60_05870 [Melioribacteraceae bacterium]|nr:hypothetical protein [Melioribacteraceae bacterium]
MKSLSLMIFYFLLAPIIHSQNIFMGLGASLLLPSSEINTGAGFYVSAESELLEQFLIRGYSSFLLSEFSANNQELKTDQYYQTQIEITGIYKPISWNIEPYVGVGLGYYNPENQQSGNANVINGFPVGIKDIKSGVGTNILIGLDLSPKSKVNFIVEFKRTFFKTNYTYVLNTNEFMENINLSSNTVSLVVRFGIF